MLVTPRIHFYNFFLMFSFGNERWNFFRIFFLEKNQSTHFGMSPIFGGRHFRAGTSPHMLYAAKKKQYFLTSTFLFIIFYQRKINRYCKTIAFVMRYFCPYLFIYFHFAMFIFNYDTRMKMRQLKL